MLLICESCYNICEATYSNGGLCKGSRAGERYPFWGLEDLRKLNTAVPNQYWKCVFSMITERRDNIEKIFD